MCVIVHTTGQIKYLVSCILAVPVTMISSGTRMAAVLIPMSAHVLISMKTCIKMSLQGEDMLSGE